MIAYPTGNMNVCMFLFAVSSLEQDCNISYRVTVNSEVLQLALI